MTFRVAERHTIRIDAFGFSVDGSRLSGSTFTFDGNTYPIRTAITSEADVLFAGADYGYDLVHTEQVAIGLTLGIRYVSAEASIKAPLLNQEGKGELQAPLPAVGLVIVVHPIPAPLFSSLALTGRLSGRNHRSSRQLHRRGRRDRMAADSRPRPPGRVPLLPRGRGGRRGRGQGRPERTLRERDHRVLSRPPRSRPPVGEPGIPRHGPGSVLALGARRARR